MYTAASHTPLGRSPLGVVAAVALEGRPRSLIAAIVAGLLAGCFWFLVADVAVAAFNYLRFKADAGPARLVILGAGHLAGVLVLVVLYRFPTLRRRLAGLARPFETWRGVVLLLTAAAVVRVVWILAVPTAAYSDGAVYDMLARRLLETGTYDTGETRAFWPPGYPFWLAGVYGVFGYSLLAAKASGVALACLSEWMCWVWVKRYAGRSAAAAAVLLLVCWPGRTLHLDILSYDDLVIAGCLLSLILMPDVRGTGGGSGAWGRWLLAGLALGLTCFVRSTLALMVPAVVVWMVLQGVPVRRIATFAAIYAVGMFAVLLPWSVRNYVVFDTFVPLTTNAGTNFYHSVAAGSDGGAYAPATQAIRAEAGAEADDELARNAAAFRLAWAEVRENPGRAVYRSLVEKPALYLGSDNVVAWLEEYLALWPNWPRLAQTLKAGALFSCNAYYVVLMLCPLLLVRRVAAGLRETPAAALCLTLFLSGFVVHSVFQAQSRYHLIYTPFWTMGLAMLWASTATRRPRGDCAPAAL